MSRGIIFHLTADPETCGSMGCDDFTDYLNSFHIDWVDDTVKKTSESVLTDLKNQLMDAGFSIVEKPVDEYGDPLPNVAFAIAAMTEDALQEAKMNFFRYAFTRFQKVAAEVTLKDFATDTSVAYELRNMVDDTFEDLIYYDEGCGAYPNSKDRTIRVLLPNTIYYVSDNTIYMH